ncbi:MAG: extensin family protein [Hyphomicrobiaceae bacterium]|nr:extensin family protein [Hyphomicrobiaceae bacterium]
MTRLPPRQTLLVAILAVTAPLPASAQAPLPGGQATPQWPVTIPAAKPPEATPEPAWSEAEVTAARAQCTTVLARVKAVAAPLDPIREGDCGAPAPIELASIGSVTLTRPAIVTCELIDVLDSWLKSDVQPLARQLLGAPVSRIDVMSSYSCRNAYGRKKTKLSEHGRANAIDIASFETTGGQQVALLADWGMTERDIKARIAAAEAAARAHAQAKAAEQAKAAAEAQARARSSAPAVAGSSRPGESRGDSDEGPGPLKGYVTDVIRRAAGGPLDGGAATGLSLGQPSRLGGPKTTAGPPTKSVPAAPARQPGDADARRRFLRDLHVSACKRFGTVLGPEANEAHRNHFHLDAAERPRGNYCE